MIEAALRHCDPAQR